MSAVLRARRSPSALVIGIIALSASGCLATMDYGVGYYGPDYYWPGYYGGYVVNPYPVWTPSYHVGPYHDGGHYPPPVHAGGPAPRHAYTAAPPSHPVPSIPATPRGGGSGGGPPGERRGSGGRN